jgi:hypothetical protein
MKAPRAHGQILSEVLEQGPPALQGAVGSMNPIDFSIIVNLDV